MQCDGQRHRAGDERQYDTSHLEASALAFEQGCRVGAHLPGCSALSDQQEPKQQRRRDRVEPLECRNDRGCHTDDHRFDGEHARYQAAAAGEAVRAGAQEVFKHNHREDHGNQRQPRLAEQHGRVEETGDGSQDQATQQGDPRRRQAHLCRKPLGRQRDEHDTSQGQHREAVQRPAAAWRMPVRG